MEYQKYNEIYDVYCRIKTVLIQYDTSIMLNPQILIDYDNAKQNFQKIFHENKKINENVVQYIGVISNEIEKFQKQKYDVLDIVSLKRRNNNKVRNELVIQLVRMNIDDIIRKSQEIILNIMMEDITNIINDFSRFCLVSRINIKLKYPSSHVIYDLFNRNFLKDLSVNKINRVITDVDNLVSNIINTIDVNTIMQNYNLMNSIYIIRNIVKILK
jgi:hypothetical protein